MEKLRAVKKIHCEIEKLFSLTQHYVDEEVSIREMESGLLSQLLLLGKELLKYIVEQKILQLRGYQPTKVEGEELESKGSKARRYLSLFGWLDIIRPRHWSKIRGSYYELDERLALPKKSPWSYNLQELVSEDASENDFRESIRVLNKLLGLGLSGKSSQRNADRLGKEVDAFYADREVEEQQKAICFSASFDGKGVPKIKPAEKQKGNPKQRKGKGEKQGIKQMATVAVMSGFVPKERSVDSIIRGLMGSPLSKVESDEMDCKLGKQNDNRWHEDIHRRSFLDNQQKAVDYGIQHIKAKMKNPNSRFVVPIDAGIGLEDKVLQAVTTYGLQAQFDGIILDIIHVSEYVWNAGTAIFGEKSKLRSDWVKEMLEDLLNSKTDKVIQDLELIRDKTKLSKTKQDQVDKTITYFTNHKHKMDYNNYIEMGYPVSSALVEAACGHLVKERMEQSGMRWSSVGAQNIMDLRAVKLNGDMEEFMEFISSKERKTNISLAA